MADNTYLNQAIDELYVNTAPSSETDEDMVNITDQKLPINEASVTTAPSSSESSEHNSGIFKPVTFVHRGEVHPVVYLHESLLSSFTDDEGNISKLLNPTILFSFSFFNSPFSVCLPFIEDFGLVCGVRFCSE